MAKSNQYAENFYEIPDVLARNENLRRAMLRLIDTEPMPGKVTEGGNRLEVFRRILRDLTNGEFDLGEAYLKTQVEIPRHESPHSHNNRVFPQGWAERLVRIQFSRFYNQAVLEQLREEGAEECFVPHSETEAADSPCTLHLAGRKQSVELLFTRLVNSYSKGVWSKDPKIPDHPHCTHVIKPLA